jgi:hypothetical protein
MIFRLRRDPKRGTMRFRSLERTHLVISMPLHHRTFDFVLTARDHVILRPSNLRETHRFFPLFLFSVRTIILQ